MAGAKGRSGGARAGAGRRKQPVLPAAVPAVLPASPASSSEVSTGTAQGEPQDMLQLLQSVALGKVVATSLQVRAAIAAVQYTHTKRGDGGKREAKEGAAKKAGTGKFASKAPPKLIVNNR